MNVGHPAPAGSHGEICKRVIATMLGALSRACPELVSADIHRTSFHNLIGGIDPATGSEFVHYEWSCGGNGGFQGIGRPKRDGGNRLGRPDNRSAHRSPGEPLPLHIEWTQLGLDSGGAGERRGGLGCGGPFGSRAVTRSTLPFRWRDHAALRYPRWRDRCAGR